MYRRIGAPFEALIPATCRGAPSLDLRSGFRFGRRTASSCTFAVGRLPNPERGCDAVQETFVDRMGLDWSQAAALSLGSRVPWCRT